jgi:hypothetical protein
VVAVAFLLAAPTGFGDSHDYVFHTAGGAAIAYAAWRTVALVPLLADRVVAPSRPLFALAAAAVIAVLWEVAEFVADRELGTTLQHGAVETGRDLAFGIGGAALIALVARLVSSPNRHRR